MPTTRTIQQPPAHAAQASASLAVPLLHGPLSCLPLAGCQLLHILIIQGQSLRLVDIELGNGAVVSERGQQQTVSPQSARLGMESAPQAYKALGGQLQTESWTFEEHYLGTPSRRHELPGCKGWSICMHEVHSHGIQPGESGQNKPHIDSATCWWYMMDEVNAFPNADFFPKGTTQLGLEKITKESITRGHLKISNWHHFHQKLESMKLSQQGRNWGLTTGQKLGKPNKHSRIWALGDSKIHNPSGNTRH